MLKRYKNLIIVDDSEMDREILRSILDDEFEIIDTDNGYTAIDIIEQVKGEVDAILLDISMPLISGFDVLRIMRSRNYDYIPVFLITAEPTLENVRMAAEYNVMEFIGKPFDREDIVRRIKSRLGVVEEFTLSAEEIRETKKYINELEFLFETYLTNTGKSKQHYVNMSELMKILLQRYRAVTAGSKFDDNKIYLISKAAYLCNIGQMLVPDNTDVSPEGAADAASLIRRHAAYGSRLIRLNKSDACRRFVQICSDMCLYHHERYDGTGYPHKARGKNISIYNQMCRLVDEFDDAYQKIKDSGRKIQVESMIRHLMEDRGLVSKEVFSLLEDCNLNILRYYSPSY